MEQTIILNDDSVDIMLGIVEEVKTEYLETILVFNKVKFNARS